MRRGTGILPVRSCGIGILPMIHGLEGAPNAEFCVGDPKPMPRERRKNVPDRFQALFRPWGAPGQGALCFPLLKRWARIDRPEGTKGDDPPLVIASGYLLGTPGEMIALRGPFGVAARGPACVCPRQRFDTRHWMSPTRLVPLDSACARTFVIGSPWLHPRFVLDRAADGG